MAKDITRLLEKYEPRLCNIAVVAEDINTPFLNFKITASLIGEKETLEIKFDSSYRTKEQLFDVHSS